MTSINRGFWIVKVMRDFKFNRINGRFLTAYLHGYYNVVPDVNELTDETSDTLAISIGKCSPF